jgi:hypothetical protein
MCGFWYRNGVAASSFARRRPCRERWRDHGTAPPHVRAGRVRRLSTGVTLPTSSGATRPACPRCSSTAMPTPGASSSRCSTTCPRTCTRTSTPSADTATPTGQRTATAYEGTGHAVACEEPERTAPIWPPSRAGSGHDPAPPSPNAGGEAGSCRRPCRCASPAPPGGPGARWCGPCSTRPTSPWSPRSAARRPAGTSARRSAARRSASRCTGARARRSTASTCSSTTRRRTRSRPTSWRRSTPARPWSSAARG